MIGILVGFVNEPLILPVPLLAMPVTAGLSLTQLYTVPGTVPLFTIVVMAEPEQIVCEAGVAIAVGVGFTVIVKVLGVPVQVPPPLVNDGVTVMVATTGDTVALVAVKLAILPAPLAARPIDGVLLVQLYTVPGTDPVKLIAAVAVLLQTTWLAGWLTSGTGVIVTLYVAVLTQPDAVVTVTV